MASRGVNKVIIIGNLGADPEVRRTQSGTAVSNIRVATNDRVKVGDNWEERTEWHRVVLFGRTAETASQYLRKGSQVFVEGRLQTRKWQDQQGNDRYSTEIVCLQMVMLGGRGGEVVPAGAVPEAVAEPEEAAGNFGAGDDDLPF